MNAFLTKLGTALRKVLPLGNNPKVMLILGAFVLIMLICLFFARRSFSADSPIITFSGGGGMLRGQAPALNLSWDYPSGRGGDAWRAGFTLVGNSVFKGESVPNNYAFSVQYITGYKYFDIGIGPSWMQNPQPYNGAHVNFNLMTGFHYKHAAVWWDHFSCGGACSPNYGRDLLLVGYRF